MAGYKHVLLATDLSDDCSAFTQHAREVSDAFNARLSLIHIIEPLPVYAYSYIDSVGLEKQQFEDAKEALTELGKKFKVAPEDQVIKIGQAKAEIIEVADQLKVDLIIAGSHIHHGLSKLLGSTANAISHAAHCDVLVIRQNTE